MACIEGLSVLLAAIVLPLGADLDTEDRVATFNFAFWLITGQTFVADVIRMS